MRFYLVVAAACLVLALGATTGRAGLVITDSTFPNGNWTQMLQGSGTVTSTQDTGFGNPAPSRRTLIQNLSNGQSGTSTSLYTATTYNPSTSGAILSWTWTLERRLQSDANNIATTGNFAVFQDGSVYKSTTSFSPTGAWLTATADQPVAALWTRISGTGPIIPNFTNGPTIQFGYVWSYTGNNFPTIADEIANVDNFSLNAATVPEPSSLALAGLVAGVTGLGAWRRRKRLPLTADAPLPTTV